jgi:hypothetical protein
MTADEWRALVEAYVEGRISADAFKRRFMEAFKAAAVARGAVPAPIQELAYVVDAYAGDPTARGHDVTDDAQLMAAARTALARMPVREAAGAAAAGAPMPPRMDTEQARAEVRRAAFTLGAFGLGGCLVMLAWLTIAVLQLFAVSAQVQSELGWGPAPSTLVGLLLAFIPLLGGLVAYFGATDVWGWSNLVAGLVFFAFPIATMVSGWWTLGRRRRAGRGHPF